MSKQRILLLIGSMSILSLVGTGCFTSRPARSQINSRKSVSQTLDLFSMSLFPSPKGIVTTAAEITGTTSDDLKKTGENLGGMLRWIGEDAKEGGRHLGISFDRFKSLVHDDVKSFGEDMEAFWYLIY